LESFGSSSARSLPARAAELDPQDQYAAEQRVVA
jgi:hypothetical protein